jgi:hypothetical protein
LTVVRDPSGSQSLDAPADTWQLTVVEAHVRPRKAGDLTWDENGGLPDVFVRILRDGQAVWESPVVDDSLNPQWNATLPRNFRIPRGTPLRIEVWDRDAVGSDPVGIFDEHGLPQGALPGADARIMLEGGSWLTLRITNPLPHRGVGIEEYEVRPDALVVARVLAQSPAGRAGIEAGDAIVAIGEQRVSALNDAQAASALSMAANRHTSLTVRNAAGRESQVDLDRGYVWLTM